MKTYLDATEESVRQDLNTIASRFKNGAGIIIRKTLSKTYENILEMIDEVQPDIVILGTHGRSGIKKAVLGSISTKLLKNTDASLLIVKSE